MRRLRTMTPVMSTGVIDETIRGDCCRIIGCGDRKRRARPNHGAPFSHSFSLVERIRLQRQFGKAVPFIRFHFSAATLLQQFSRLPGPGMADVGCIVWYTPTRAQTEKNVLSRPSVWRGTATSGDPMIACQPARHGIDSCSSDRFTGVAKDESIKKVMESLR